mgnify:CR=1 FL=1
MKFLKLRSIKPIEHYYDTGEKPVLVVCSDTNAYICKYMRSSASAYKLACELIGSVLADSWHLCSPSIALVNINPNHWTKYLGQNIIVSPSIGFKKIDNVVDITPSTSGMITPSFKLIKQLMKIALFDFWVANEDRNVNNANLLFDLLNNSFIPIDFGCIFNTASFDFHMTQLTSTDSILSTNLFHHLVDDSGNKQVGEFIKSLSTLFFSYIENCHAVSEAITTNMPREWNIPTEIVENKLQQLFDEAWIANVWNNFEDCIYENIKQ